MMRKYLVSSFILLVAFGAAICVNASQYTPVPEKVAGVTSPVLDLNGTWRFNPAPKKDFAEISEVNGKGWADIQVPGEWSMQGFTVKEDMPAAYFRTFDVPVDWKDKAVKLRSDGIYSESVIWINGKQAGSHLGAFTAFDLDVTDYVKCGENTIVVSVKSESIADDVLDGSRYANHTLGGISRKIRLIVVPRAHMADLYVQTVFDKEYKDAELHVHTIIQSTGRSSAKDMSIKFELIKPDGNTAVLEDAVRKVQEGKNEFNFKVKSPLKWDSEHPNLYFLKCTVEQDGKIQEVVKQRFGFRQVEVKDYELCVNGQPVKLPGIGRMDVHPLLGRALTPELQRKDVELFKDANANYTRFSITPAAEEYLDACDEIGMYVENEVPACWFKKRKYDQEYYDYIENAAGDVIAYDRNHPCVIIRSAGNESRWSNLEHVARKMREIDPSIPLIFNCPRPSRVGFVDEPKFCELACWHYPGLEEDYEEEVKKAGRPYVFDEFAHIGRRNNIDKITDPGLCDLYGIDIDEIWDRMYQAKGVVGGAIWCGVDEVIMITDNIPQGYGFWGVIDGWRREKPEHWNVKKAYSPVKIRQKYVKVEPGKTVVSIDVENRYSFSNLGELDIKWSVGDKSGTVDADVARRSEGKISMDTGLKDMEGKRLHLTFGRYGRVVDVYDLVLTSDPESQMKQGSMPEPVPAEKPSVTGKDDVILIRDKGKSGVIEWVLDSETGLLKYGSKDGAKIVRGGPYLNITPKGPRLVKLTVEDNIRLNTPMMVYAEGWMLENIDLIEKKDFVRVVVNGNYDKASVAYRYDFYGNGQLKLSYDVDFEKTMELREFGLAFDVASDCQTLKWDSDSYWTHYPDDHIGRPEGTAVAFPAKSNCERMRKLDIVQPPVNPTWPWSLDCTPFGCNDFRSTKRNIHWASLCDKSGVGVGVKSNASQNFRAFVEKECIKMHMSQFTGVGERRRSPRQTMEVTSTNAVVMLSLVD